MNIYEENIKNIEIYDSLVEKTNYSWCDFDLFPKYLQISFERYQNYIISLQGDVKNRIMINKEISVGLFPKIIETVTNYLRGKIPASYKSMDDAFELIKEILVRKSIRDQSVTGLRKQKFVFKARTTKGNEPPPRSRSEMFHIPFELRHIVQSQRFSSPGIPSIYLGESIYDCYLELGMPNLDNFWVSLFHIPDDIKFLDLSFAFNEHRLWLLLSEAWNDEKKYAETLDKLVDDILLWPLIMACSIACKFPNATFKQEYIVPQILYQLCSAESGFNGLKYYSTKINWENGNELKRAMINYAIPAQDIKISGYCPYLAGKLSLTESVNAAMCQELSVEKDKKFTSMGLPIIGKWYNSKENKNAILSLDKMTMYFNKILEDKNIDALQPLNGWNNN